MKLSKEKLKSLLHSINPFDANNGNFVIDCPKCGKREAGISYIKDLHPFGCYRKKQCGITGNIYDIVKILGIPLNYEKSVNAFDDKLQQISDNNSKSLKKLVNLPDIRLPIGFRQINYHPYLDNRGFNERDYQYWQPGITTTIRSLNNYLIFPIYQKSALKAYVSRTWGDQEPKYKNSPTDFAYMIGGFDQINDNTHTVIIVEGLFDVFNVTRLLDLYDYDEIKCICTFGAKISQYQISMLVDTNVVNVIVLFDNDVVNITKKASFLLDLHFNVKITYISGDDDPGSCSFDQLQYALDHQLTPIDYYSEKL